MADYGSPESVTKSLHKPAFALLKVGYRFIKDRTKIYLVNIIISRPSGPSQASLLLCHCPASIGSYGCPASSLQAGACDGSQMQDNAITR
jgi:hypothetical protein